MSTDRVIKSNILSSNKPFACDVTSIRLPEYQYVPSKWSCEQVENSNAIGRFFLKALTV